MTHRRLALFLAVVAAACEGNETNEDLATVVPCVADADCGGRACVAGVCTDAPAAAPDAGTPVIPVENEAPDAGEIDHGYVCRGCTASADCGTDGTCVRDEQLNAGSCASPCATSADCGSLLECSYQKTLTGSNVRVCFPSAGTCDAPANTGGGTTGGGTTGGGTTGGGTNGGGTTGGGSHPGGTSAGFCGACDTNDECGGSICVHDPELDAGACGAACVSDDDCPDGASCFNIGTAGKACFPDVRTCDGWGETGGGTTGGGTTGGGTTGGGTTGGGTTGGGTTGAPNRDLCSECESDDDCLTGMCLEDKTLGIGVCGTDCFDDTDCPSDASCEDIYGGWSGRRWLGRNCFPRSETCSGWGGTTGGGTGGGDVDYVCDYCESNRECPSGMCLWDDTMEDWGGSCGSPCATNADCPSGTECGSHEYFIEYDYVRSCFPRSNTCF